MKMTPLDIQQQQFRVKFRGIDMVEVDNFLDLMANEFEELLRENNRLKEGERQKLDKIQELEGAEKELRNALISAQQICDGIKNNARKEGELIIEGAKDNARKILEAAQAQALEIEAEITKLKRQRAEFGASLRSVIDMHLRLLGAGQENRVPAVSAEEE
jgi:cell division initiation protein